MKRALSKKNLSLVLFLILLVSCLPACGLTSSTTNGATGTTGITAASAGATSAALQKNITLHIFAKKYVNHVEWSEMQLWGDYEKISGVHVEFETAPAASIVEKRNLKLAANDLPDAFWACDFTNTDLITYGADGVLIPLNKYIDNNMPNLLKQYAKDMTVRAGQTMPNGNIYSFPGIFDSNFDSLMIGNRFYINKTWLSNLNLAVPTTTDEFYAVLKAFKEKDANKNGNANDEIPLGVIGDAKTAMTSLVNTVLTSSWNLCNRGGKHPYLHFNETSKACEFAMVDTKYKEVLTYANKLCTEGLIDPEIFTMDYAQSVSKAATGCYGVVYTLSETIFEPVSGNYVGVPALKGPYGDKVWTGTNTGLSRVGAFTMTKANKYPAETAAWVDYFYSEPGMLLFFFGREGENFTFDSTGNPKYVENVTHNKNGLTMDEVIGQFSPYPGGGYPGIVAQKYFNGTQSQSDALESAKVIAGDLLAVDKRWPSFTYTLEEADKLRTYEDMTKYVDNMTVKFVKGDEPLANWDAYVKAVKNMDVDGYLKIYQDAYARYNSSLK